MCVKIATAVKLPEFHVIFTQAAASSLSTVNIKTFLVNFAGTYAFRNPNKGSWFVQALSKVFQEYGTRLEITRLLTRVNRLVSENYESKTADPQLSRKKQMPCFVSMLRKDLYFKKK